MREQWSPQQIAGRLKEEGLLNISHETHLPATAARPASAMAACGEHLRLMPKFGRKRYGRQDSRGVLPGKRHISERPAEVEPRLVLGHWEGDTVMGSDKRHCVLTLTERASQGSW